jgi:DNA-binding NtrC family response regulator
VPAGKHYLGFRAGISIARRSLMPCRLKVLIVEDDNALAQMCAKLIRRRGHSAIIARSCHDALAIVREGGDIDVVVSDVQMPQMTGFQLLALLHAMDSTLPIILMTGCAPLLNPNQAIALGASDYIIKPFDSETLVCSLERVTRSRTNVPPN